MRNYLNWKYTAELKESIAKNSLNSATFLELFKIQNFSNKYKINCKLSEIEEIRLGNSFLEKSFWNKKGLRNIEIVLGF